MGDIVVGDFVRDFVVVEDFVVGDFVGLAEPEGPDDLLDLDDFLLLPAECTPETLNDPSRDMDPKTSCTRWRAFSSPFL